MTKGTHGSTYGGNPLAIAIGTAVINEIMSKNFLKKVNNVAKYLWKELILLQKDFDEIIEIRGAGLLLGIKTRQNNIMISDLLKKNKLLSVPAGDNVIRLAPPLNINKKQVDDAINIIDQTFKNLS